MAEIPEDDQREERDEAFATRLGVERWYYLQAISTAVKHSLGAVADPDLRAWRQWSGRNIGGRVRSIVQNKRNPSVLYAGSAQGGVFKTSDGGDTWRPIGLPQDSFPVGAMAIAPASNVLYVGSGEPAILHDRGTPPAAPITVLAREAAAAGTGFYRYDEVTQVFTQERLPIVPPAPVGPALLGAANSYARIVVDPATEARCWIASHTGLWRREAAANFIREPLPSAPAPAAPALGACVTDVALVPDFDSTRPKAHRLFAALAGVGIFRGVFTPNPVPTTVWEPRLTNGLPTVVPTLNPSPGRNFLSFDRIKLAVCESFPNHLYAVYEDGNNHDIFNVYHSSDGGTTWVTLPPLIILSGQAWSNLCIAVHRDNPAIVVIGEVDLACSLDYGQTFQKIIDWGNFTGAERSEHGDNHEVVFDLAQPNRLWVGNDGGISMAPDVVNFNPRIARTWRKRSHGLCISQFNDITSHPTYPFMIGGGLQDNGTYITFGGPTWMLVGDADGGQMSFELLNSRRYMAPNQGSAANPRNLNQANVVAGSNLAPVPGSYPLIVRSLVNADLSVSPNDVFAVQLSLPGSAPVLTAVTHLFVQTLLHHRSDPNQLLAGRRGDLVFSTDGGVTWARGNSPAAASEQISALAYGVGGTAPPADWWAGSSQGRVFLGTGAAPLKAWAAVFPPGAFVMRGIITCIAVHPNNNNYIAIATGGTPGLAGNSQGQLFLSNDHGANWIEITGITPTYNVTGAVPAALPLPRNSLPPCPLTSLAFDPTVPAGSSQVLYVGTLGGIYVIRNLPRLPAGPPPPIAVPAPFTPNWSSFNGPAAAPLPLTLVNDLELVTLPARPGAPVNSPESVSRLRLYAALYGRGIFVSDITPAATLPPGVPPGGPGVRLFIRQHLVEDGLSYPRITPTVMNTAPTALASYNQPELDGDPRLPVGPAIGPNRFNDISAYDIRVDNEPFQFFDEVLDGVEFDEELKTKIIVPGQLNAIYVQMHTAGWDRADAVDMHLFFAQAPAPGAGADPNPLPNLQADFWAHFTDEPQLPPSPAVAPAAFWQRIGSKKVIPANRLSPSAPVVMRFEWVPPAALGGGFVGLLAVCTSAADPLPIPPPGGPPPPPRPMDTILRNLIRAERRVAFRLVPTTVFTPDVYIRDSIDDDGRPGAGGFTGRSPDIIVVQAPAADAATEFRDLLDMHAGDRIRADVSQTIYVRVHNRRAVPVQADVEVLWAKPNAAVATPDAHAPIFDGTTWARIAPAGVASVTVPANGWALTQFTWQAADLPQLDVSEGAFNAIGLIALVSSAEGAQDVKPVAARVRDATSFWQFFNRLADSNNAAMRAIRHEP